MDIVETPGTLSGNPRIDGTRIGVLHILAHLDTGETPEEIAEESYPHLSVEQVEEAVSWLYAHPERVFELRLNDLVATEKVIRSSVKPPMSIYRRSAPYISEEFFSESPGEDDIIPGLSVLPDGQFVRIYHDPLHESHAVYSFDLDTGVATPLLDDQHVTLSDAVERAVQHFEETTEFICDRVETRRSVCLDDLPSR